MTTADAKNIGKMSFEEAACELENIVGKLESGSIELESAISFYERGSKLKEHCEKKLNEAKLKVEKIIEKEGKAVGTEESDLKSFYE